jgi:hypothetical protein
MMLAIAMKGIPTAKSEACFVPSSSPRGCLWKVMFDSGDICNF